MPRIRPFVSTIAAGGSVPTRQATASAFGGGPGAASASAAFGKVGDAFKRIQDNIERQEVSDVNARLYKLRADWTLHVEERARQTPPGDMSFATKIREELADTLDKMGADIQGRRAREAFEQGAARLRADISLSAAQMQAQLAAEKASLDYGVLLDASRNTLLNDPTQYDSFLKQALHDLNDPRGGFSNLDAKTRAELTRTTREEFAKSAVQGLIRLNPEFARKQLESGRFDVDLDADTKAALLRNAEVAIRAEATEQERARREAERKEQEAQEAEADGLYAKFAAGELTMKEVLDSSLPAFGDISKERFRRLIAQEVKSETPANISRQTTAHLMEAIHAPEDDPRKVRSVQELEDQFIRGRLTK
ncbi:MAG: hypothetical protein D6773_19965, partial [Alphaproteobacteria bacterium]